MFWGFGFLHNVHLWDFLELIRYGVCNVYVGCGGWFVASGPLVCYLDYNIIAQDSDVCSDFLYCYLVFGHIIWWAMVEINSLLGWLC